MDHSNSCLFIARQWTTFENENDQPAHLPHIQESPCLLPRPVIASYASDVRCTMYGMSWHVAVVRQLLLLHAWRKSNTQHVLCRRLGCCCSQTDLQNARRVCRHWRQHITGQVEACPKGHLHELDLHPDPHQWQGSLAAVEALHNMRQSVSRM
jgi:hypothetical protein